MTTTSASAVLAAPLDTAVHTRPIVVFDGGCGMCRAQMRRLERLDWFDVFDRMEYDEAIVRFPEVDRGSLGDGLRVRFPDASVTVGIDAVRSIGIRLLATAPLAWGLYLPGVHALGARVYARVAARRRRDDAACTLEQRRR